MIVTYEINECNIFNELWGGAADTLNNLSVEDVRTILDVFDGEEMTITELNDFFWFERDTIAEWLGYDDFDELMNNDNDND